MTFFKICALIICYFVSRAAFSANCETWTGYSQKEKVCWEDSVKGWVSESCLSQKCEAKEFFKTAQTKPRIPASAGGQNPDTMVCHALKFPVIILKDAQNNEQSFCVLKDKSIVSAEAIGGFVK
ncbi:hypothetical protein ACJVC5_01960 [Peredibacter sp. HCB2-198]|uniref:hypothetical protein n=1 Tax=Peredibacter sp. HCB2-198 TaxID=3383025 RepID=UPI0038B610EF